MLKKRDNHAYTMKEKKEGVKRLHPLQHRQRRLKQTQFIVIVENPQMRAPEHRPEELVLEFAKRTPGFLDRGDAPGLLSASS
ncbi:MAG: hypothetical protein ACOX0D_00465 [Sphaerochaeta sp.]